MDWGNLILSFLCNIVQCTVNAPTANHEFQERILLPGCFLRDIHETTACRNVFLPEFQKGHQEFGMMRLVSCVDDFDGISNRDRE